MRNNFQRSNYSKNYFSLQAICSVLAFGLLVIFISACNSEADHNATTTTPDTTATNQAADTATPAVADTAAPATNTDTTTTPVAQDTRSAVTGSNTADAKPLKDGMLGNWIQAESGAAKIKMVVTKDAMVIYDNGKLDETRPYTWVNDNDIEFDVRGVKLTGTVTIKGDELLIDVPKVGMKMIYNREAGNTANASDVTKPDGTTEKEDCQVKIDNANLYVAATNKDIKLKKGTPLMMTNAPMGQGIIVVKAKVGNEWIEGEIQLDDTTCNG